MLPDDARAMLECLKAFGAQHSNPVLEVLGGQTPVNEKKYPQEFLEFGSQHWRAFYHCHAAPDKDENEHGHFHLFSRMAGEPDQPGGWAHVAGLSMSSLGQPLAWISVNHWVTDGEWLAALQLPEILSRLKPCTEQNLLARWLALMLKLFQSDLVRLYQLRDARLAEFCQQRPQQAVFKDRSVYTLASRSLDFEERLVGILAANPAGQITPQDTLANM